MNPMTTKASEADVSGRELLELAARAAGFDTSHPMNRERMELDPPVPALWIRYEDGTFATGWNPLESDADALRLAVKLRMSVVLADCECCCRVYARELDDDGIFERFSPEFPDATSPDAASATRLAITRAAAAIAKGEKA